VLHLVTMDSNLTSPSVVLVSFHQRRTAAALANTCNAFVNSVMHKIAGLYLRLHCRLDSRHTASERQSSLQQACKNRSSRQLQKPAHPRTRTKISLAFHLHPQPQLQLPSAPLLVPTPKPSGIWLVLMLHPWDLSPLCKLLRRFQAVRNSQDLMTKLPHRINRRWSLRLLRLLQMSKEIVGRHQLSLHLW